MLGPSPVPLYFVSHPYASLCRTIYSCQKVFKEIELFSFVLVFLFCSMSAINMWPYVAKELRMWIIFEGVGGGVSIFVLSSFA